MRWLARGEPELPGDDGWLSARERAQAASIRFTKRQREYLTRRFTAKHAIADGLELSAVDLADLARIEVRNHPSGAPWVAVDDEPAPIEISLTDRAGWAVCLVGTEPARGTLGIDLELVEPRSTGFVNDFLTEPERRYVLERTGHERDLAANLMWSAKEAALKVLQVGLRADTRTVEVEPSDSTRDDGWAELAIRSVDGEHFHGWWRRDGWFVLTVATRAPIDPPALMPGSADLASAEPTHSWLTDPLVR